MDVYYAINLTLDEIVSFNHQVLSKRNINIDLDLLKDIVKNDVKPDDQIYWNVWVDNPFSRGVPIKYIFEGDIIIYFIINSENCDPLRFETFINWTREAWDKPKIKIRMGKASINNDEERVI